MLLFSNISRRGPDKVQTADKFQNCGIGRLPRRIFASARALRYEGARDLVAKPNG
jgi:hypothetical protein